MASSWRRKSNKHVNSPTVNPNLQLLLQLEELVLLRQGLGLVGSSADDWNFADLDKRIEKLRRSLPGRVLSVYDRLARQYPDVVTVIADGVCQGCHGEVSTQVAALAGRSSTIPQCEHCGRFVLTERDAPDYVI